MNVLLIDDHPLFRCGLRMVLSDLDSRLAYHEAEGLRGATALPGAEAVELVLYGVPDDAATATRLTGGLRAAFPDATLVALVDVDDARLTHHCLQAGAGGVVPKCAPPGALVAALRAVIEGRVALPVSFLEGLAGAAPGGLKAADAIDARVPYDAGGRSGVDGLDLPDQELLWMSIRGMTAARIAERCGLPADALEHRQARAWHALGASDRLGAVVAAAQRGLSGRRLAGVAHSGS